MKCFVRYDKRHISVRMCTCVCLCLVVSGWRFKVHCLFCQLFPCAHAGSGYLYEPALRKREGEGSRDRESKRAPFCKRIEVSGGVPVLSACPLCTLGIYVISYSQREKDREREIIIFSGQRFQALFFIRMSLSLLASLFPSQTSFSLSSSIFLFLSTSHSKLSF